MQNQIQKHEKQIIDGLFCCCKNKKEKGKTFLTSGSDKSSEKIYLANDQEVIIWGVVTYVIHQVHH